MSDWRAITNAIPKKIEHIEKGTLIKKIGYPDFVPGAVRRIVNKACAADPAKRFNTATEFGQRLDALRFSIDWIQNSDFEWSGSGGNHHDEATVDAQTNNLTVRKNGRRINDLCQQLASLEDAVSALHEHIAATILA